MKGREIYVSTWAIASSNFGPTGREHTPTSFLRGRRSRLIEIRRRTPVGAARCCERLVRILGRKHGASGSSETVSVRRVP